MNRNDIDNGRGLFLELDRVNSLLSSFVTDKPLTLKDIDNYPGQDRYELQKVELDTHILNWIKDRVRDKKARLEKELADLGITIGEG